MKRQALRCVLSEKARQDRLVCLDSTDTIDGKTKSMAQLLANLQVGGSALVITKATDKNVVQAAHNLEKIWTLPANQLNAQELLARDLVIMTVEAARWVEETYSNEPHGRRGAKWTNGSPVADAAEPEAVAELVPEPVVEETETPATEEEAPKPRRRRAAATTEAPADAPAEEEAPKPRRRRAAAKPEAAAETATETSAETSGDAPAEEAPKPRTRRRRTTASTADEPTSETPAPEADTPDEEA
jgi:hypothetical protein